MLPFCYRTLRVEHGKHVWQRNDDLGVLRSQLGDQRPTGICRRVAQGAALVGVDDPNTLDTVRQVILNLWLQPYEPVLRRQNLDDEEGGDGRQPVTDGTGAPDGDIRNAKARRC